MTDFATRRRMMVDSQIRPSDVTKFPIIAAMLAVQRENFVPASKAEVAYMGEPLHLGGGRALADPRTLAKLLDALELRPEDMVLDIAPATGYSSAVLARIAAAVVAVEPDAALAAEAEAALHADGADAVIVLNAPAAAGAPEHGPFDAMVVECGVETFPQALVDQLKDGGRVGAVFMSGALGTARLGIKHNGALHWRDIFNATLPVLAEFRRAQEFSL
jgi:protein-L-isoaspartate(D-aspartate) O-methyltransferase